MKLWTSAYDGLDVESGRLIEVLVDRVSQGIPSWLSWELVSQRDCDLRWLSVRLCIHTKFFRYYEQFSDPFDRHYFPRSSYSVE